MALADRSANEVLVAPLRASDRSLGIVEVCDRQARLNAFSAEDALRTARLGRELLEGLGNPGADWVKLEVLADSRTLLPDPVATNPEVRISIGGSSSPPAVHLDVR